MPDELQKVQPGQSFRPTARAWNAFIDAARRQENGGASELPGGRNTGIVTIKNASGSALDRFGVLGIDTALITPTENPDQFKSRPMLSGITPTSAHVGKFVVLLEPLANGAIGRAYICGVFPCKINVTDEDHKWADIDVGNATRLESSDNGAAFILYKESGTGDKFAYVHVGFGADAKYAYVLTGTAGGALYEICVERMSPIAIDTDADFTQLAAGSFNAYGINIAELPATGSASGHALTVGGDPNGGVTLGRFGTSTVNPGYPVFLIDLRQNDCGT